jgi:hypothetical protein
MRPYIYAAREIRRRKYRTAGNVAGFVIAIAALITLVMAARGWEACTAAPMKAIGTDIILIYCRSPENYIEGDEYGCRTKT